MQEQRRPFGDVVLLTALLVVLAGLAMVGGCTEPLLVPAVDP